jgi:hypothetical protein
MREARVIELIADVENPQADRRRSDWEYNKVLKRGTRFIVITHNEPGIGVVRTIRKPNRYGGSVYERNDLGKAILAMSKDVQPETVAEFIDIYDCINCEQVVKVLLKKGRITNDDFVMVRDELIAESIEEEKRDH